jgi:hypothetical protein
MKFSSILITLTTLSVTTVSVLASDYDSDHGTHSLDFSSQIPAICTTFRRSHGHDYNSIRITTSCHAHSDSSSFSYCEAALNDISSQSGGKTNHGTWSYGGEKYECVGFWMEMMGSVSALRLALEILYE